jgi:hypothetical protein
LARPEDLHERHACFADPVPYFMIIFSQRSYYDT